MFYFARFLYCCIFLGTMATGVIGMEVSKEDLSDSLIEHVNSELDEVPKEIISALKGLLNNKPGARTLILTALGSPMVDNFSNNPDVIALSFIPNGSFLENMLATDDATKQAGVVFCESDRFFMLMFSMIFKNQFTKIVFDPFFVSYNMPKTSTLKLLIRNTLKIQGQLELPYLRDSAGVKVCQLKGSSINDLMAQVKTLLAPLDTCDLDLLPGFIKTFPMELAIESSLDDNPFKKEIDEMFLIYKRFQSTPEGEWVRLMHELNINWTPSEILIKKCDANIYNYVMKKVVTNNIRKIMQQKALAPQGEIFELCKSIAFGDGSVNVEKDRMMSVFGSKVPYKITFTKPAWLANSYKVASVLKVLSARGKDDNPAREDSLLSLVGRDVIGLISEIVARSGREQDESGNFIWNYDWDNSFGRNDKGGNNNNI